MVKCPVCEKNFNSEFALKGHLRFSRDPEHIAYMEQYAKTTSRKAISENTITRKFTENRMMDTLESFIDINLCAKTTQQKWSFMSVLTTHGENWLIIQE